MDREIELSDRLRKVEITLSGSNEALAGALTPGELRDFVQIPQGRKRQKEVRAHAFARLLTKLGKQISVSK